MDATCSLCGAPAERRFTEVVAGRKRTMALCLDCAERQDLPGPVTAPKPKIHVKFQAQLSSDGLPAAALRCPHCGTRLVELRKSGRVGCGQCYEVFRKQILPLLKRIHGATEHEGSAPGAGRDQRRLRDELRQAIQAEDYERAARLRDRMGGVGDPESGQEHE